eukprot:gb/GECH01006038.1/.p1 GENE.gb/GECH01006038.1/~~gb/GECH01006038.1/.p1  ORF type:complete len:370 (+),score=86.36 gb/GECH01006038.1/:1-1110(+)
MSLSLDTRHTTRTPVIFEIGSRLTRCGFSGEGQPRIIISTPTKFIPVISCDQNIFRKQSHQTQKFKEDLEQNLFEFLQDIYFNYLFIDPKKRSVVILEDTFSTAHVFRNCIENVLINKLKVKGVSFAVAQNRALFTTKSVSGIVIDCGWNETRVVPICGGRSVIPAVKMTPLGMAAVFRRAQRLLKDDGLEENRMNYQIVEDIIVRACFVSPKKVDEFLKQSPNRDNIIRYQQENVDKELGLNIRSSIPEILFDNAEEPHERSTLPETILESLLSCDFNVRSEVCSNILVCGGTSTLPGFNTRLFVEIHRLLNDDPRYHCLQGVFSKMQLCKTHFPPNIACWVGTSVTTSLEENNSVSGLTSSLLNLRT